MTRAEILARTGKHADAMPTIRRAIEATGTGEKAARASST